MPLMPAVYNPFASFSPHFSFINPDINLIFFTFNDPDINLIFNLHLMQYSGITLYALSLAWTFHTYIKWTEQLCNIESVGYNSNR